MQRRGKRGIVIGVVAAAALAAATVGIGWPAMAAVDRGAVTLHEDAKPWDCASGTVSVHNAGVHSSGDDSSHDYNDPYYSLATVDPKLDCRLRLVVSNSSGHPITVTDLTLPLLGHGNAIPVDAVQLDGDFSTELPTGGTDDTDAHFRIRDGLTIDPDSSAVLVATVRYVHKSASCRFAAGTSQFGYSPTITVDARGISGTVADTTSTFGFAAPAHSCI